MVEVSDRWQDFHQLTNQPEGNSGSRPWHWQNSSMQRAENVPPPPPLVFPQGPGDLQPHPPPASPQPPSWAPSPCRETTNTNPFPEGRSQNQLLGVVFTNKAALWGLRLRLGVASQQNVWCTPNIMASTVGNLGNHFGNARLQRGPFKIRLLFTRSLLPVGDSKTQHWQTSSKTVALWNVKKKKTGFTISHEERRWETLANRHHGSALSLSNYNNLSLNH